MMSMAAGGSLVFCCSDFILARRSLSMAIIEGSRSPITQASSHLPGGPGLVGRDVLPSEVAAALDHGAPVEEPRLCRGLGARQRWRLYDCKNSQDETVVFESRPRHPVT